LQAQTPLSPTICAHFVMSGPSQATTVPGGGELIPRADQVGRGGVGAGQTNSLASPSWVPKHVQSPSENVPVSSSSQTLPAGDPFPWKPTYSIKSWCPQSHFSSEHNQKLTRLGMGVKDGCNWTLLAPFKRKCVLISCKLRGTWEKGGLKGEILPLIGREEPAKEADVGRLGPSAAQGWVLDRSNRAPPSLMPPCQRVAPWQESLKKSKFNLAIQVPFCYPGFTIQRRESKKRIKINLYLTVLLGIKYIPAWKMKAVVCSGK
jgi:hypothetical protein